MRNNIDATRRNNAILMESLGHTKLVAEEAKDSGRSWALKQQYINKVKNEKLVTPQQLQQEPPVGFGSPWKKNSKKVRRTTTQNGDDNKYGRPDYVIDDKVLEKRTSTAKANEKKVWHPQPIYEQREDGNLAYMPGTNQE